MTPEIGIKADPILYRHSYDWLFSLMNKLEVSNLQFGSFFEMYQLPDRYFTEIRRRAEDQGIRIRSCFTSHRELGGFFINDLDMQQVALDSYRRYIEIGALLGADAVGSNPGAVLRDEEEYKEQGTENYLEAMIELAKYAFKMGLKALTIEPMSCTAEPPTTPSEITYFMTRMRDAKAEGAENMVPVYLCGDTSHGFADVDKKVINSHIELFEHGIPWMYEFHFKNTDEHFNSTFGFSSEELERGIVHLDEIRSIVERRVLDFPVENPVGYLELPGPKLGRDYSDHLLEKGLTESTRAIQTFYLSPERL